MPRCQSSGATLGSIFATLSNPSTDWTMRPASKSATARFITSRGLSACAKAGATATRIAASLRKNMPLYVDLLVVEYSQPELSRDLDVLDLAVQVAARVVGLGKRDGS